MPLLSTHENSSNLAESHMSTTFTTYPHNRGQFCFHTLSRASKSYHKQTAQWLLARPRTAVAQPHSRATPPRAPCLPTTTTATARPRSPSTPRYVISPLPSQSTQTDRIRTPRPQSSLPPPSLAQTSTSSRSAALTTPCRRPAPRRRARMPRSRLCASLSS